MKAPFPSSASLKQALTALLIAGAASFAPRAGAQAIQASNAATQSQSQTSPASAEDDFLSATPRPTPKSPSLVDGYVLGTLNGSTIYVVPEIDNQLKQDITDDPARLHLGGGLADQPEEGAANAPGAAENQQGCAAFNALLKRFVNETVDDETAFENSLKPLANSMFSSFLAAAKKNNPAACCNLAACYYYGFGTTRNIDAAAQWYLQGRELGDKRGARGLGLCLQALTQEKDNRKTILIPGLLNDLRPDVQTLALYKESVDDNDLKAYMLLGKCYLDGTGVRPDSGKAFQIFRRGGDAGSGASYSAAGFCYASGFGVDAADKQEAFKYYALGAKLKSAVACYNVAVAYLKGEGTLDDVGQAAQYFWLSANLGYPKAYMQLSTCYLNGIGVRVNKAAALSWLKKAALLDDSDACYLLGVNYLNDSSYSGSNRALECLEGMKLLYRSALLGNGDACYQIGLCHKQGNPVDQSDERAFNWFQRAAQHESSAACMELAQYYKQGIVVPVNPGKAAEYERRAKELNLRRSKTSRDPDYQYRLGFCFNLRNQSPNQYAFDAGRPIQLFYRPDVPKIPELPDMDTEVAAAPAGPESKAPGVTEEIEEEIHTLINLTESELPPMLKMGGNAHTLLEASDVNAVGAAENNEGCAAYREAAALLLAETGEEIPLDAVRAKLDLAARRFRDAAELGNGTGSLNLGACFYYGIGVDVDFAEAFLLTQNAIDQNEPRAYRALAEAYAIGQEIEYDPVKAFELYQTGAGLGDVRCHANLGYCYLSGTGVAQDRDKALEEYRKGIDAGDGDAAFELLLAQTEEEMDLSLLTLAAERGVGRACVELFALALNGFDPSDSIQPENLLREYCYDEISGRHNASPDDPVVLFEKRDVANADSALNYLYRAAELGDAQACEIIQHVSAALVHLPYALETGWSSYNSIRMRESNVERLRQDPRFAPGSAARWARRAAELGRRCFNPELQAAVAKISDVQWELFQLSLDAGNNSAAELNEYAQKLFNAVKEGAETNDAQCRTLLGLCYLRGMGTPKNEQAGLEQLQKGADLGYGDAFNYLGDYYYDVRNYQKALELYHEGVALNSGECCNSVGVCYASGSGVARDVNAALKWYERALRRGDANAACNLALYYEQQGDLKRALEYFDYNVKFPTKRYIETMERLHQKQRQPSGQSAVTPQPRGGLFRRR